MISSALDNGLLDLYATAPWAAFLKGYSLAGSLAGAYSASPAASLFDLPPGATVTAPRK